MVAKCTIKPPNHSFVKYSMHFHHSARISCISLRFCYTIRDNHRLREQLEHCAVVQSARQALWTRREKKTNPINYIRANPERVRRTFRRKWIKLPLKVVSRCELLDLAANFSTGLSADVDPCCLHVARQSAVLHFCSRLLTDQLRL